MTLEPDPIAASARHAVRQRRLGPDAACTHCGLSDPAILTRKRPRLEAHHVAGRANDTDLLAVLCLNCHAAVTARQHDAGILDRSDDDSLLERLARTLLSLAIFTAGLTDALRRWAQQLIALAASLDQALPTWRTLDPAR